MNLVVYKDLCNDGIELFAAEFIRNIHLDKWLMDDHECVTGNDKDHYKYYLNKEDFYKCLTITSNLSDQQVHFLRQCNVLYSNCDALTQ